MTDRKEWFGPDGFYVEEVEKPAKPLAQPTAPSDSLRIDFDDDDFLKDEEDEEDELDRATVEERREREIQFYRQWSTTHGERLPDDLMNYVADIIQNISPKKIGGLFAVQYSNLLPSMIRQSITPDRDSVQILYDRDRDHYFVAHYRFDLKIVVIYDSLHGIKKSGSNATISKSTRKKLYSLFGHLFPSGIMRIAIDLAYDQQIDSYSCGYRALGALLEIAKGRDPCRKEFSRSSIFQVIMAFAVEDKSTYTWDDVCAAYIGERAEPKVRSWVCFFLHENCYLYDDPSSDSVEEDEKKQKETVDPLMPATENKSDEIIIETELEMDKTPEDNSEKEVKKS